MTARHPPESEVVEATITQAQEPRETEMSQYLKLPSVILISIVLCLATFCVAVDNTIISTAVPQITKSFDSLEDVGWYASYVIFDMLTPRQN